MNVSRAAKALAINQGTLKLWIDRPELSPYFSASARRPGVSRDLNDDDVVVANTIRSLRAGVGNNNVDWQQIADQLGSGYRDRSLPPEADHIETGLTVIAQHERLAGIITERDAAITQVSKLESQVRELSNRIDGLQDARREDTERLLREVADQRERAIRAEIELELWRLGQLKPKK